MCDARNGRVVVALCVRGFEPLHHTLLEIKHVGTLAASDVLIRVLVVFVWACACVCDRMFAVGMESNSVNHTQEHAHTSISMPYEGHESR
jgi:hypothetical protein